MNDYLGTYPLSEKVVKAFVGKGVSVYRPNGNPQTFEGHLNKKEGGYFVGENKLKPGDMVYQKIPLRNTVLES